jgi:hypothetical protein
MSTWRVHAVALALLSVATRPALSQQATTLIELKDPILVYGDPAKGTYLHRPIDYAAGNADTFYVLDRGDQRVIAFDDSGRSLFTFGRQGQGPGEFETPWRVSFHNNTVLVIDRRLNRLILFDAQGQFRESIQLDNQPLDLEVGAGSAFLAVASQRTGLVEVSLGDLKTHVPLLQREAVDLRAGGDAIQVIAGRMMGGVLALSGEHLTYVSSSNGQMATLPLRSGERVLYRLSLSSPLVDEYFERFKERQRAYSGPGGLIPSLCRHASSWPRGSILVEVLVGISTRDFRPTGVVFDPLTGKELGVRVRPSGPVLENMKLVGRGRIAGIEGESATIKVFELPKGWENLGNPNRDGVPPIV